jgi:exopolysaccharide biosynthesis polyprenyl glycosylphosphotransferase
MVQCVVQRAVRWLVFTVTLAAVVSLGELHAHLIGHYHFLSGARGPWDAIYILVLSLSAYGMGLPDLPRTVLTAWVSAFLSVGVAAIFVSLVQLALGTGVLPRFTIFGAVVILVPCYALLSTASYHIRSRDEVSDRVLVVARGDQAEALRSDLARAPERPGVVVASLDPAELEIENGSFRTLAEVAAESQANLIVLDREAQASESVVAQAAVLHATGTRVHTLSLFYEEWLGKLPLTELERMSLMFDIQEIHAARYARVKRFFDIVLATIGAVVLIPVVLVVAALDLAGNRGPLLYRQRRVGMGGVEFTILKFRTMKPTADPPNPAGSQWTERSDPRIGPVGRWLRRTHLDELPQVLNVLRGDLSFVGPRPEQPAYVDELRLKIPFYDVRHLVHPGLTGWAQVKFDYGASVADALEKLQYEFFYLRHQSLTLDARIVVRTLRSVIHFQGR